MKIENSIFIWDENGERIGVYNYVTEEQRDLTEKEKQKLVEFDKKQLKSEEAN